jgi:ribosomal protein S18 acetylase RimI-like enzyme
MSDVTMRAARAGDIDRLIAILCDEPQPDVLGIVPDPVKARKVGALIIENGFEIDVRRTSVAVLDGQVVGLLEVKRPGEDSRVTLWSFLRVIASGLAIVGPGGLLRYVRYQRVRPRVDLQRPANSFYIGELDVHADFRNRGIGGVMLSHAEEMARREGFARMSLTTSSVNPAQHLYMRHGYRIVETKLDTAYERMTGIPGRVLMVKELG